MRFLRWLTVALAFLATTHARPQVFDANTTLDLQRGVDVHGRQLAWKSDVHDSWVRKCIDVCYDMGLDACRNPDTKKGTSKTAQKKKKKQDDNVDTGWKQGQMTYYWGSEPDLGYGTGTVGGCDNPLKPFKSVAVPQRQWEDMRGRTVSIKGVCTACVVDDLCAGPACKELDLYVGNTNPNKYDGIKDVQYKIGKRVQNHPCLK